MKLGFPVQLLLLTGVGIATITVAAVVNKSPLISSRAMNLSSCEPIYPNTIPKCGREYVFRFRYNAGTGRCEEFIACNSSKRGFASRETCLQTCNNGSICLKIGWRYGGEITPWYYYDAEEDECIAEEYSSVSRADLSPKLNAFQSEWDCLKECMPSYNQWG